MINKRVKTTKPKRPSSSNGKNLLRRLLRLEQLDQRQMLAANVMDDTFSVTQQAALNVLTNDSNGSETQNVSAFNADFDRATYDPAINDSDWFIPERPGQPGVPQRSIIDGAVMIQDNRPDGFNGGGNRGDVDLLRDTDADASNDASLTEAARLKIGEGMILATLRDNSPVDATNTNLGIVQYQTEAGNGENTWIAQAAAPENNGELSVYFGAAFFPYADGWTGTSFAGDGSITSGTGITVTGSGGRYEATVTGVADSSEGFLFGIGGDNEDNYTRTQPIEGGGWRVQHRDNSAEIGGAESDDFNLMYIPRSAQGLIGGVVDGSAAVSNPMRQSFGDFTIQRESDGHWRLSVPGHSPTSGVLVMETYDQTTSEPRNAYFSYDAATTGNTDDFIIRQFAWDSNSENLLNTDFAFFFIPFENTLSAAAPLSIVDLGTTAAPTGGQSEAGIALTANADGTINYAVGNAIEALGAGETQTDQFVYSATDGTATNSATATIIWRGVNDAPTIVTQLAGQTFNEDAAATDIDLAPLFADLDANDSLAYSFDPGIGGILEGTINGTVLSLAPAPDRFGATFFGITATDTAGASVTMQVAATVFGQDDGPRAIDDTAQTDKLTAIAIDAKSNDFHPETTEFSVAAAIVGADVTATDNAGSTWTVSATTAAPNEVTVQSGGNLGDVEIGRGGVDLSIAEGVLLGTIRENASPYGTVNSYAAFGSYGFATDTGTGQAAGVSPDSRAERNTTVSTGFFPFQEGWTSGHVAADGTLIGGVGISQANITTTAEGLYTITIPGVTNASTEGILLAISQSNDDNVVSVLPSTSDGSWMVRTADSDDVQLESDAWSFVYIPETTPNLLGGKWMADPEEDDGMLIQSFGGVTASQDGPQVRVTIPGYSAADGALLAIASGSSVVDLGGGNIVPAPSTTAVMATTSGTDFLVSTRAIPTYGNGADNFQFVFLPFDAPLERIGGLDLSISAVDAVSSLGASVSIQADGTLLYDPTVAGGAIAALATGQSIDDTFTYTLTDARTPAQTSVGTVTVRVTGENQPPTAVDDKVNINEAVSSSTLLTVLGNDTDPDFDAIYGVPDGVVSANLSFDDSAGTWSVAQTGTGAGAITLGAGSLGNVEVQLNGTPIAPADGIVVATIRENFDGPNTDFRLVQAFANSGGGTSLALTQFGADAMASAEVAVSFFPFGDNWIGGHVDPVGSLTNGSGVMSSDIIKTGVGRYEITIPGLTNAATDGFLFGLGNEDADNVISSRAIAGTNRFEIAVRDNSQDFGDGEDGGFSFVFVPRNAENLVAGTIDASSSAPNSVLLGVGDFSVERLDVAGGGNEWKVMIPGQSPSTGVLLLANQDNNELEDNYQTYEASSDGGFLIRNHDMPSLGRQSQPFTFMFIPFADPGLPVARPVPGPLSIQSVDATSAAGATLTAQPDGTILYEAGGAFTTLYNGQTATDTFTYTMTDGFGGSDSATVTILVEGIGEAVAITTSSGATVYGIGDAGIGVDSFLTVSDSSTPFLDGAVLTTTITGGLSATDVLAIRNEGTGAGQVGISGTDVTFGGTVIGSFSGGNATPLVITFGSAATPESVELVARAITFANTDSSIAPGTRTVQFDLVDANSQSGPVAVKAIEVGVLRRVNFQEGIDYGYGVYQGSLDTEISESDPTGAQDPADDILIDYNAAGAESQALLRFEDLFGSAAGQIPAGAIITSANLILETNPSTANSSGDGARFLRMLQTWNETDTWTSLGLGFDQGNYDLSGIKTDDVQARSAHESQIGTESGAGSSGTGVFSLSVLPDVRAWAGGADNFGWVFKGWELRTDGWFFSSTEDETPTSRPRLEIEWVPASEVSTATFRDGLNGYTGTVDTQLVSSDPDADFSTGETLFVDDPTNQVLLRFEELIGNAAGQIPAGSEIITARLRTSSLTSNAQGDGGTFHPILVPWSDTSTYNSLTDGIATDGSDAVSNFNTQAGFAERNPNVQGGFHTWDVTTDLQNWVNGSLQNLGWAITPWASGTDGWGFQSSDATAEGDRPTLEVFYIQQSSQPLVASRGVLYNASGFDGDAGSSSNDDAAVASNKQPYVVGSGPATFANYTSYHKGINGVVVDVANAAGTLTLADFTFKVGNDNSPAAWPDAPAPSIDIRPGAGLNGADRVTFLWPDNAIQNQWLQVTVLASANTGLTQPDVHYWGNQIGETGNDAAATVVDAADAAAVRANLSGFSMVPNSSNFDINRDRRVNAIDHAIIQNNLTGGTSLVLLNLAASGAARPSSFAGGASGGGGSTGSDDADEASDLGSTAQATPAIPPVASDASVTWATFGDQSELVAGSQVAEIESILAQLIASQPTPVQVADISDLEPNRTPAESDDDERIADAIDAIFGALDFPSLR